MATTKREMGRGPFYVLSAAILFSMGGLCIKIIPWNAMAINGGRNLIAIIVIGTYIALTGHKLKINMPVIIGAFCIFGTNTLFVLANKLTTAGNAIILQFTAPIFVLIISWIIYGQKPQARDIKACIAVFSGICFFFLDSISAGNWLGNTLALISGITYAGVFMLKFSPESDPLTSMFMGLTMSFLTGLPWLLRAGTPTLPTISALLALGILQLGIAYIMLNKGLETTPPVMASLMTGIEPILNPLWVAIFYKEMLTPLSLVGAAIVFASVTVYNYMNAKLPAKKSEEI